MLSKSPENRGTIDYWCESMNILPSTVIVADVIPAKERYPKLFTDERIHNGLIELQLCKNGALIDKQVYLILLFLLLTP